jgi:hypothetical protein
LRKAFQVLKIFTGKSKDMEILKKSVSAMLPILVFSGIGLSAVPASASTIGLSDISNSGANFRRPDHVPPVNPPIDTPAFYNGLLNTPATMPASVPSYTLPGSGFGQSAVPIPAAAWLFGSGLLGLIGIARRNKAT